MNESQRSLIYQYLKRYRENPASRVFAPLAEAYRKAGLFDEAIEIAREGLQLHPTFVGGRVALARALFDKKDYASVIEELRDVVREVPDNLVAQRLYAESHLMLGNVAESLDAFKMLLYFSPLDEEARKVVAELETQSYEKGVLVLQSDPPAPLPEFAVHSASEAIAHDPEVKSHGLRTEWMRQVEVLQELLLRVERARQRRQS